MVTFANASQPGEISPPAALDDGPVEGAMMPLVRINGNLYVVPNTLHFYCPAARQRTTEPEARCFFGEPPTAQASRLKR